jgi:hypothetical protein
VSRPIDFTTVDVPVKGASGSPAVAQIDWRTPPLAGHYCLQARIVWPFDANPDNNLGQHNVDVKALNSPTAQFTVPVRNTLQRAATIRLVVDGYELPRRPLCPPETVAADEAGISSLLPHPGRLGRKIIRVVRYSSPPHGWRATLIEYSLHRLHSTIEG